MNKNQRENGLMRICHRLCIAIIVLCLPGCVTENGISAANHRQHINQLLDGLHAAAARADKRQYLAYFSEQAVFMGTDDWERWPLPAFTDYVDDRFKRGKGWSYQSEERHIRFSDAGDVAWFDEILVSPKWGRFRGTGVLTRRGTHWKLAHYSMSVLVPNELWGEIFEPIKAAFNARQKKKPAQ